MKALGLIMTAMIGLTGGFAPAMAARADAPGADPVPEPHQAFFENRVRPVLARNCVSCHGPRKQKSGLRLDQGMSVRRGGDTGPVIVPGNPDDSRLIQAIRYDGDVQMPPTGKLTAEAIDDLTAWVRMGAPWPEASASASASASAPSAGAARSSLLSARAMRTSHWSFRPVRRPERPAVKDESWPWTSIDHFSLARLETSGLAPASDADRRTLIRRATFDLIGLPPTLEEVEAFVNDRDPGGFARVVDRLLASPHYGERWGRHWLDVARYADTKGYVYSDREEIRFPFAYTYRDYVVRALNQDTPYDRFIREQIAADGLEPGADRTALAALGFLTLGRRFLGNVHDIIDDRLDVVFRGFQALTIGCARCHDHKFDPIPTRDYYALYGVFAGTTEETVRLGDAPAPLEQRRAAERELRARQAALHHALEARRAELSDRIREKAADYLKAVLDADSLPGDELYVILSPDDLNPVIVRRWQAELLRTRNSFHPIFAPWHAFASLPRDQFAARAPAVAPRFASDADPEQRLNPLIAALFTGPPPVSMSEVAVRYGTLLVQTHRGWRERERDAARRGLPRPTAFPDSDQESLRQVLYAADSPATVPPLHLNQTETFFDEKTRVALGQLQMKVDQWPLESAAVPPHALILVDIPNPRDPRVFLRGNPKAKGEEVPRQFLEVLAGARRRPFTRGSGRLDLATAIADRDNPLTARVLVNRVWMHHFGQGLVRTPSDFGSRSEPPTHPELLDDLARRFLDGGWSIKALHRLILTSHTYQQSGENSRARSRDPENRLLGRVSPRRLEWEPHRDALLAVAGRLDTAMGGRPIPLGTRPFATRRTLYGFIDRQDLPGVFRAFNLANPDQHTPQRHATTIPQQALFLMNNPFVIEMARQFSGRPEVASRADPNERITAMYRLAFQRDPTGHEVAIGRRFLSAPQVEVPTQSAMAGPGRKKANASSSGPPPEPSRPLNPWEEYAQVLLLSNEFAVVD